MERLDLDPQAVMNARFKKLDYIRMLCEQLDRDGTAHAQAAHDMEVAHERRRLAWDVGDWQEVEHYEAIISDIGRREAQGGYSAAALDRLVKLIRAQLLQYGRIL